MATATVNKATDRLLLNCLVVCGGQKWAREKVCWTHWVGDLMIAACGFVPLPACEVPAREDCEIKPSYFTTGVKERGRENKRLLGVR